MKFKNMLRTKAFRLINGQTAHTIGKIHCEGLLIPFYGAEPNTGHVLQKGMTLSIEPGVATGSGLGDRLKNRETTMIMRDNQFCCYWEHILAVTDTGYDILDLREGESELPPTDSFGYKPNIGPLLS
jgi:methionyl aminopeptidase